MGYKILHRHGTAGPGGRASYLIADRREFATKSQAMRYAKENYDIDGARYVQASQIKPSSLRGAKGLYYVKKSAQQSRPQQQPRLTIGEMWRKRI